MYPDVVCQGSIKYDPVIGKVVVYVNGRWIPLPSSGVPSNGDPLSPSENQSKQIDDPVEAYKRAKRHVQGM